MTLEQFIAASPEERRAFHDRSSAAYDAYSVATNLRPLAAQASPGPWFRSHGCVTASHPKDSQGKLIQKPIWDRFLFSVEREKNMHGTEADARWICAADPYRVGKLLDATEALVIENENLRAEIDQKNKKVDI